MPLHATKELANGAYGYALKQLAGCGGHDVICYFVDQAGEVVKKHKVLLVVRWPIGGIRSFFRYVYRHFDASKYEFVLVAPAVAEADLLVQDLAGLGIEYIALDKNLGNRELFFAVTRLIRNGRFGLVHSHGFTAAVCSAAGCRLTRTAHITTLHETLDDGHFIGLKGRLKKHAMGAILSTVDAIHCVSDDARDNLLAYLKVLRRFQRKLVVVPHGIDVARFQSSTARDLRKELGLAPDTFLVGFLGRYMPEKGFRFLVDALQQLKNQHGLRRRPLLLSFGPDDAYIREERNRTGRMGLSESVRFLPFVADVAATLKGLDVVAMPSLREAAGLVAMETMVAGIPLIATECIGLREVIRDTPAYAVPPRDVAALAHALLAEMTNPTTAKARQFAAEAASRFRADRQAAAIERLMLGFLERST